MTYAIITLLAAALAVALYANHCLRKRLRVLTQERDAEALRQVKEQKLSLKHPPLARTRWGQIIQ